MLPKDDEVVMNDEEKTGENASGGSRARGDSGGSRVTECDLPNPVVEAAYTEVPENGDPGDDRED